jgi:hypothetical protein
VHCYYLRTVFARLAGPDSKVYGIDYIEPLVQLSERNINADDKDLITSGRIKLYTKDGWQGLPDEAPFDAIHVGAAAATVPKELVSTNTQCIILHILCFIKEVIPVPLSTHMARQSSLMLISPQFHDMTFSLTSSHWRLTCA